MVISPTLIISIVFLFFSPISLSSATSPTIPDKTHHGSEELQSSNTNRIGARWLHSAFAPYFINGNSIYGGYYDPKFHYSPKYSFGSERFYTQTLPNYLAWSQGGGIYGFGATYDFKVNEGGKTVPNPTSYSFFKSIPQNNKQSDLNSRSFNKFGERDELIQCRNQKGQPSQFSRSDCESAATKMVNQKSAISNFGSCGLVLVGPQGQLSSSNLPIDKLRSDVQNILNGCKNGPSNFQNGQLNSENRNSYNKNFMSLPKNSFPTYVVLLVKGNGYPNY